MTRLLILVITSKFICIALTGLRAEFKFFIK